MRIKQIPEDFVVRELYDLEKLRQKPQEKRPYYYFLFTKRDYTLLKGIEKLANVFHISRKNIHFAGTKDRVGITTQLISMSNINSNFMKNVDYVNEKLDDFNLEYVGEFPCRLNLGDNLGNSFEVVVRDLNSEEIDKVKEKVELIKKQGVPNFFDSQRFGYAGNSHIVGKYILQNKINLAVKEILTSLPPKYQENHKEFVDLVLKHWEDVVQMNVSVIENLMQKIPQFLKGEKQMLNHLKQRKNDFPGALRLLPKKLRTLYIGAYQSFIFNETLKFLDENSKLREYTELSLVNTDSKFDSKVEKFILQLLKKDELALVSFDLNFMPELKPIESKRELTIKPKNLSIRNLEDDDLNEGKKKIKVSFDLDSGSYATNLISYIFD